MAHRKRTKGGQCSQTKADGAPCRGWAPEEGGLCFAHHPAARERAQAARAKGGSTAAGKEAFGGSSVSVLLVGDPPKTRSDLRDLVARTINWTLTGELDPKRADAVIKLAKGGMALFPEAKERDPHDDLTDRELLAALEKEAAAVRARMDGGNGESS